jgi:uncharacterized protein DUF5916/cellulose/xylan binding protein with CBM9 domain
MRTTLTVLAALLCASCLADAQPLPDFRVSRAAQPPKLDGALDDAVWQSAPLELSEWISYNPLRGEKGAPRTEVRVAYDDRNLYFAFRCVDDEPEKIRTNISKRDDSFNDDWVALSLDSTATGQTAYHLFVNPSGIQMDAVNTASSGERFDSDLVWDSAGRRTADGYVVEMAVPLQTIRFTNGQDVRMGIMFFRHISRTGKSFSWPDMPPGQWVFNRHAHLLFDRLQQRRLVELLPSATYPITQTRATPSQWNPSDGTPDAGLSGKFGITSNVTFDGTINPDFSQVESDAFQVQVNQRFPIFFSEKRPFFMEGSGLFNIAGTGGDGNMRNAVHTRRIIDPQWGAKLTGTSQRLTFGLLSASDETPQDVGGRGPAVADAEKLFTIARATYGLGESNYAGAIVTDTEHAGRSNRVAGTDLLLKFTPEQELNATYLYSHTAAGSNADTHGTMAQATYKYDTRRLLVLGQLEHYDRDFQMDTAFYNRTGFTGAWSLVDVSFYPKTGNRFGLIRVHPFVWSKYGRDRIQNGDDRYMTNGIRFNFTRQGFLGVDYAHGYEPWAGRRFKAGHKFGTFGNVQLFRWLNLGGNFNSGWSTFYDPIAPFQGTTTKGGISATWQPNSHIRQEIDYNRVSFDRASNGARVFSLQILNSKTTYQFDKHFLIRLLEQFDSSSHRLLTDLLGSYELVPGTVLYAGYGSVYEQRGFDKGQLVPNTGNYLTVSRGLFFKASYLHRF